MGSSPISPTKDSDISVLRGINMAGIKYIMSNYSDDELREFIRESYSIAELGRKLGLSGKNIYNVGNKLKDMFPGEFDHFTGQAWNKHNFDFSMFRKGVKFQSKMRKPLIYLRGHMCEYCGNTEWLGNPIPLEVHHKDGDSMNNCLDNLVLTCPNCHALTDNYRGKNSSNRRYVSDKEIIAVIKKKENVRQVLLELNIPASGYSYRRIRELARSVGIYW